jgi:hypothetical protein
MFASIRFLNFRGFADLSLEGLKPVNLIVGRNNAGKTSLLEGLYLIGNPSKFSDLNSLLRTSYNDSSRWLMRDGADEAQLTGSFSGKKVGIIFANKSSSIPAGFQELQPYAGHRIFILVPPGPKLAKGPSGIRFQTLSIKERPLEEVIRLFGIAMKQRGGEARIENLLREVDSRFVKIRVDPSTSPIGGLRNDLVVDLGLSEMIPILQSGQGMFRLVSIFAELVGGQPQVCIIDEIENGLHHSILEDVWTGLAAVSRELNIQIFATTHSYECIAAAHKSFCNAEKYDFGIVQLFRDAKQVQGRVLDRKHIEAAIAGDIDLR